METLTEPAVEQIAPPSLVKKTTKAKLISGLLEKRAEIDRQLAAIEGIQGLDALELDASFWSGRSLDFDRLSHDEVIAVIGAMGGKWNKTPGEDAAIHYETEKNGITIRMWNGQPPPNCKIVEVLETIPAVPERVVTKRKLVCQ